MAVMVEGQQHQLQKERLKDISRIQNSYINSTMLRIDRRLIKNFDWITFSVVIIIALIGIMTIYSATRPLAEGENSQFYLKQSLWLIIGVIALFMMVSF